MDIVFSANELYAEHLGVVLLSILENNSSNSRIAFHILTSDISATSQQKLQKLVEKYKKSTIKFILIDSTMFDGFPLNIKHITKEAYFRYVIADVIPNIAKALYLDVDTLILKDLSKLWSTNIKDFYIAGSHKDYFAKEFPGYKEKIGLREDDIYINSGVILMNLDRIRESNKVKELFDNTERLKDIIRIQDQDIINITFNGGIKNISNIYNFTESDRRTSRTRYDKVVIAHFNTSNKPWNDNFEYSNTNRYFTERYLSYKEKL